MKKTIKIEVYGGCVTEVTGLPEGYDYEIVDHDHKKAEGEETLRAELALLAGPWKKQGVRIIVGRKVA